MRNNKIWFASKNQSMARTGPAASQNFGWTHLARLSGSTTWGVGLSVRLQTVPIRREHFVDARSVSLASREAHHSRRNP